MYFPGTGAWYEFDTGRKFAGGSSAAVDAPIERLPLFVRAGAIVPMGPVTQYVDERRDAPLTIAVYAGADGSFSLYEDDGRSTSYKTGAFSRIPIRYDDRTGTVSFGKREGAGWAGMPTTRTLRVKWIVAGQSAEAGKGTQAEVTYEGEMLQLARPRG